MVKEKAEEKLTMVVSERDEAMKALEEERADQRTIEEQIKKEAFDKAKEEAMVDILTFEMSYRCSALFMIRQKYPDLDLSNVDLTFMEGHDKPDSADGSSPVEGQGAEETVSTTATQLGE